MLPALWGACPAWEFAVTFDCSQDLPSADCQEKKKKDFAKQMKDVNEIKVRIFKLRNFSAFSILKHL